MKRPLFKRVTIVGVGLIGGSLGLALRRRKLAREVVGVARRRATLTLAKRRRAITHGTLSLVAGVAGADLVILATPPSQVVPLLRRLRPQLADGAVVTDVASTKQMIVTAAEQEFPGRVPYVGSHPLAGSEQQGVAAAEADLFDGHLCVVTPTPHTDWRVVRTVKQLWTAVGSRVIELSPRVHDQWIALLSHVPHLLAIALMNATPPAHLAFAPRSFRDLTRIAQSSPALWRDVLTTNRVAVLAALAHVDSQLSALRSALLRHDDAAILREFARAKQLRDQLK